MDNTQPYDVVLEIGNGTVIVVRGGHNQGGGVGVFRGISGISDISGVGFSIQCLKCKQLI
jgi:hypothetical protein